ncbi:MAG: sterol desaturase family protein [Rhodospirillales bacterium]|nr:sterol desaturase family protein [Rhodospirillales bacterium]
MAGHDELLAALPAWPVILAAHLLLIVVPAGAAFLALYAWKGNPFRGRKIQPGFAPSHAIRREVFYSLLTAFIFALNGVFIYVAMANGWTLIYSDFADYGWLYGVFSLAVTIVLHDAYFYWTHRLMHHPRLFDRFHRLHHESHSPSPWAAYAFAPLEAVIQAMFLTILIFILPLHVTVIYLFMLHMIVRNVIGHSGFELFPRGMPGHAVFGVLTTITHHDLHHSSNGSNYGLYFTWWDRLAGTEHPKYREAFDRVTHGQAASADSPLSAPVTWNPGATDNESAQRGSA